MIEWLAYGLLALGLLWLVGLLGLAAGLLLANAALPARREL